MNGTVIWVICSSSGGKYVVVGKVKRAAQVRHKCGGGCESNYIYLYMYMQQIEPRVVILCNVYKGQNTCAYYGRATQDKQSDEHKHILHNNIWTFAMSLQVEVYYTCTYIYKMLHCINSLCMCITWPGGGWTRDSMNITISCLVILRCPACNRISHKLLCIHTYVVYSAVEHYQADIRFFLEWCDAHHKKSISVYVTVCVVVYQFS